MKKARRLDGRGFTLLELLVALSIFAIMTAMAYSGLNSALTAETKLDDAKIRIKNIAFFFNYFDRQLKSFAKKTMQKGTAKIPAMFSGDLTQYAQEGEKKEETAEEKDKAPEPLIVFICMGSSLEGGMVKRVGYRINKKKVELMMWPGIDIEKESKPESHLILDNVEKFAIKYLNKDKAWQSSWGDVDPPRAVQVILQVAGEGEMNRIFSLQ